MQRPTGVTITFALMCATTALDYLLILRQNRESGLSILIYSLIVAACYVFLWFYLQGRNWARWIVILLCAQSLWAARSLFHQPWMAKRLESLTLASETLVAFFLIFYLSTPAVRLWFHGNQRALLKRR
jgi:hypothetical protein